LNKPYVLYFLCLFFLLGLMTACTPTAGSSSMPIPTQGENETPSLSKMKLESSSFPSGGTIPKKYACPSYGQNVSPALNWSGLPDNTQSLALTVTDPDAGGFVHWVVYNLAASLDGISEAAIPDGVDQGMNGFGASGWGGPCPPSGTHRYVFTLYALDVSPDLKPGIRYNDLQSTIKGHILGQVELVGKFSKP
jgi:Raf kinase inhibitor-like YbhB/YbcL family protein